MRTKVITLTYQFQSKKATTHGRLFPHLKGIAVQWKNTGGLKQKHKKQPFSDASASHLSLVLWHV